MKRTRDINDRIDEKLERRGDCLIWTGRVEGQYPVLKIDGKREGIRRIQYERHHGPIPASRLVARPRVDLICGNPLCLHPGHMKIKTDAERELTAARQDAYRVAKGKATRDPSLRFLLTPAMIDAAAKRLVATQSPVGGTPEVQAEVQAVLDLVKRRSP